jgi:outer membrane protein assembly factor BamB
MSIRPMFFAFVLGATVLLSSCERDWPSYRYNQHRSGHQEWAGPLSDPGDVSKLKLEWTWPSTGSEGGFFKSSPIVFEHRVFIGSSSGFFYALDAKTGNKLWQYPDPGPALLGTCKFGNYGIQSSATRARIHDEDAVIFGAPDPSPSVDGGLGSARLWALNAHTGKLIWASDVVAHVNGTCTNGSLTELHERIAYSSPLVHEDKVYVGIHDAGDDPIQNGKLVAVDLQTGHIDPAFSYVSTSTRGGGVWNSPAADEKGVYFTTGNTRNWNGGSQPEPPVNNGLSMVRVNRHTGAVDWKFQPVPYNLDDDPDWSAGAAVMHSTCGDLVESVQKDGWTYAVNASTGSCRWQYPPTNEPSCAFPPGGPHVHGDTHYKRPGATWGDVLIINAGGWGIATPGVPSGVCGLEGTNACTAGYARLHALNSCTPDPQRARWILDVPSATPGDGYGIGAPTVTGGIVYVTTNQGHVVAIADPALRPPAGFQCTNEFINPSTGPLWPVLCVAFGFQLVPTPQVLANVALPDGSSAAALRNEPAITRDRLFVSTMGGHVYALSTK